MKIHTSGDVGKAIKTARLMHLMSQEDLAKAVGANRRWVGDIEAGNETAEVGRVLRAFAVLGINLAGDKPKRHKRDLVGSGKATMAETKTSQRKQVWAPKRQGGSIKVTEGTTPIKSLVPSAAAVSRSMNLNQHLARFRRA